MSARYPSSIPGDSDLYVAADSLATAVGAGGVDGSATTIPVDSTTNFPTVGIVAIGTEKVKYANKTSNSLTDCTRGFSGTAAAAHLEGEQVRFNIVQEHHNELKDEIIAIATDLYNAFTGQSQTSIAGVFSALVSSIAGKVSTSRQVNGHALSSDVTVTKADVGLGNVDNTTDAGKPVSTAQQTALDAKLNLSGGTLSGALTVNAQLIGKGTTTDDDAAAGYIGEAVESKVAVGSPVFCASSGQWKDLTTVSLSAGDWDVNILVAFGGATTGTRLQVGLGTVTGNDSTGIVDGDTKAESPTMPTAVSDVSIIVPSIRVKVPSGTTTTYRVKMAATYSSGTPYAYGRITARRRR